MIRLARLLAALSLGVPIVVGVAFAVGAPTASAGGGCHGTDPPARTDAQENQIKVGSCFFAPTVARVPVGATVTFFNGEGIHLITGANGEWGSRDVEVGPGPDKVSFTFDEAGIYPYACALHSGMSGAIVVGDANAAAAVGAPTQAAAPPADPRPPVLETSDLVAGLAMGGLALALVAWLFGRRVLAPR